MPHTDAGRRSLVAPCAAVLLIAAAPWIVPDASAQSLPDGWRVVDIGGPSVPGTAAFAAPTLTVTSRGYDVNGTKDQFTFVNAPVRGDVTIVARLASLSNADPWAQAGLMVRDGSRRQARHVFLFATPGSGFRTRYRMERGGDTHQQAGGSGAAPVWLKLERRSSIYILSRSANGTSWTQVRRVTVPVASSAIVGFAVASRSKTATVTAAFDNISINGQGWALVNKAPTVSLTSPASGSTFLPPATIALAATAADSDGTIAKVDFYNGTTLLGTDTTSPYTFSWTGVPIGTYGLKAIATDDKGASTTSATANVTVSVNLPPLVSMTSPTMGASFVVPATVTFSATASDPDGSVAKVEFYLGSTLVGTDTTRPYSVTWPAVAGVHSVSAVATDDKGARTVSGWIDFMVTAAAVPSTAVFRPASPADSVDYYVFEIFSAGADPRTATPVATQNLGIPPVVSGESSANVRDTIWSLSPGNYIATVSAVGAEDTLRSNTFAFTR